MLKKILKKVINILKILLQKIINIMPFKINSKKIIFDNFLGKGYGCNPKYIAEELIRQNVDCDMVWVLNDLKCELPLKIRKVKYGSLKAYYEWATAKVWIDNVRNYKGVDKKKEQFYIQTWHAPLGFKKVEKQVEESLSKKYVEEAKKDGEIADLIPVNNEYMANLIRKYFWYDGEIIRSGLPRNDIIGNPSDNVYDKVYKYFNLDKSQKIVVYSPTFRTDEKIDAYKFDYEKVLKEISNVFGNDFVMLLRLHPNVSKQAKELGYSKHVLNATQYDDVQEILAVADILITDYSSTMFDFSMFDKPVFLLMKDFEEYKKKERSIEFNLGKLPFPIAYCEEELCSNINLFSKKAYQEKCDKFYEEIGLIKTNKASEVLVEKIKKIVIE